MKYTFNTWSEKEKRLVFNEIPKQENEASQESTEVKIGQEAANRSREANNVIENQFNTEKEKQLFQREGEKYDEAEDNWKALKTGKTDGKGNQFIYRRDTIENGNRNGPRVPVLLAYTPLVGFQIMTKDAREWKPLNDSEMLRKYDNVKNDYSWILDDNEGNKNKLNQNKYNTSIEESCLKAKTGASAWFDSNHDNEAWRGINANIKEALDVSLKLPSAPTSPVNAPTSAPAARPTAAPNAPDKASSSPAAKPPEKPETTKLQEAFKKLDTANNKEEQIAALLQIIKAIQEMIEDLKNPKDKNDAAKPVEEKPEEKPKENRDKLTSGKRVESGLKEIKGETFGDRVSILRNEKQDEKNKMSKELEKKNESVKDTKAQLAAAKKSGEKATNPEEKEDTEKIVEAFNQKIKNLEKSKDALVARSKEMDEDVQLLEKIQKKIEGAPRMKDIANITYIEIDSEHNLIVNNEHIDLSKDETLSVNAKPEKRNSLVLLAREYEEKLKNIILQKIGLEFINNENKSKVKNSIMIDVNDKNEITVTIDVKQLLTAIKVPTIHQGNLQALIQLITKDFQKTGPTESGRFSLKFTDIEGEGSWQYRISQINSLMQIANAARGKKA